MIRAHAPDILTLDVEMPGMDGLEFLSRLMRLRPMPVVMVSSLTEAGSDAALRALKLGALDCIGKPRLGTARETFARLADLLVVLSSANLAQPAGRPASPDCTQVAKRFHWNGRILLIGASTGGVEALETLFASFPENAPPTLVTQHMPAPFLASFAKRLDTLVAPSVRIAQQDEQLEQGKILIAPGGAFHLVFHPQGADRVSLREGARRSGHRPSVDEMFLSARPYAPNIAAALLTGMGRDGAEGLLALRRGGALTVAQDAPSSVVHGMPRVAAEIGAARTVAPLCEIAGIMLAAADRNLGKAREGQDERHS